MGNSLSSSLKSGKLPILAVRKWKRTLSSSFENRKLPVLVVRKWEIPLSRRPKMGNSPFPSSENREFAVLVVPKWEIPRSRRPKIGNSLSSSSQSREFASSSSQIGKYKYSSRLSNRRIFSLVEEAMSQYSVLCFVAVG